MRTLADDTMGIVMQAFEYIPSSDMKLRLSPQRHQHLFQTFTSSLSARAAQPACWSRARLFYSTLPFFKLSECLVIEKL